MTISTGQQNGAGFRTVALPGQADLQGGLAAQPARQAGDKLRVHVLHDDHRRRKISRQTAPAPWPARLAHPRRRQ